VTDRDPRVVLVPLDERPVCTTLPALVGALAGVQVVHPPPSLLADRKDAGDAAARTAWLVEHTPGAAAVVVSVEGLGSGGLLPSRVDHTTLPTLLHRLAGLATVPAPVLASVAVPRIPDVDDDAEEPAYWAGHGRALHAWSRHLASTDADAGQADATTTPPDVRRDWLARRHRQHLLAQWAVGEAAAGRWHFLLVGIDDSVTGGLSEREAADLRRWARWLEADERVLVHPGADESGTVLVARAAADVHDAHPTVVIDSAATDLHRIPPYEGQPVGSTARGHVLAAGGTVTDEPDAADGVVVVHGPQDAGDWALGPPSVLDPRAAEVTTRLVQHHLLAGRLVVVADVAFPNGADPALVAALDEAGVLSEVTGYAGWNTAGNTLGTAAATLVAAHVGRRTDADAGAVDRLRALRVAEDWGWMTQVRPWLRRALRTDPTRHDHIDPAEPLIAEAADRLRGLLPTTAATRGYTLATEGLRLPWQRTFEADIRLEPAP
jgi:hypothetical protein